MSASVVSWEEFVQRVRRHRPSELLPAIARANIAIAPDGAWKTQNGPLFPWALAVAARESIHAGNEHRTPGVTGRDLIDICRLYHNLYDPIMGDQDGLAAMVRIAFEQFPFQEPFFFGLARSRLLFEQYSPAATAKLRIIDSSFWLRTIGSPLDRAFAAGMVFAVGALKNAGTVDYAWWGQSNFTSIAQALPPAEARNSMSTLFAADAPTLKSMCVNAPGPGYERVTFNPLRARPFIDQGGGRYLAPVPQFAIWRASAPSLYYLALEHLSRRDQDLFTNDVGTLFEDYVLRQAKQLPLQALYPEIEYQRGKHSADAILVWPDFILLVEVKTSRLTQDARMGGKRLRTDITRTVDHAFGQLDRTAALIQGRHSALAAIPANRPIYGLVVTLEPYYFMNTTLGQNELGPRTNPIPAAVVSIADFERFVADTLAERLTSDTLAPLVSADGRAWDVDYLLEQRSVAAHRNPLLDAEYKKAMSVVAP